MIAFDSFLSFLFQGFNSFLSVVDLGSVIVLLLEILMLIDDAFLKVLLQLHLELLVLFDFFLKLDNLGIVVKDVPLVLRKIINESV